MYRIVSRAARGLHKEWRRRANRSDPVSFLWRVRMTWTKPEAEVVAVTMEVTAYVATL
jgi:hypothetical protein